MIAGCDVAHGRVFWARGPVSLGRAPFHDAGYFDAQRSYADLKAWPMKTIFAVVIAVTMAVPAVAQTQIFQTSPSSAIVTQPGGVPHSVILMQSGNTTTILTPAQPVQPQFQANPASQNWQQFQPGQNWQQYQPR
jgi:hypothetical protein